MTQVRFETYISTYADAFRSVRAAKNIFWVLLVVAVLAQVASFVLVDFVTVLGVPPGDDAAASAWREVLDWALQATQFLAMVLCCLLVLTLLFGVKLSLIGRLGSTAGFLSAFFWSLLLLAALVPWQSAFTGRFACGALFTLPELLGEMAKMAPEKEPGWLDKGLYYARFLAYPVIALLLSVATLAKSARGMRGAAATAPAAGAQPPAPPQ